MDAWRSRLSQNLERDLAQLSAQSRPESPSSEEKPNLREGSLSLSPQAADKRRTWLPTVASILGGQGLPEALLGVAAVESGFDPTALSPKGALGLWQLMPQTARRYGLVVNARRDDRLDPAKSTYAAANYLKDLYAQFGSWPLALAAYNAGEDRVQRALDRLGARDFWTLRRHSALPEETRRYVPAVLARMNNGLASPASRASLRNMSGFAGDSANHSPRANPAQSHIVYATPSAAIETTPPRNP